VPKRNGTESVAIYLPGLSTHMKINFKSWICKVGGETKITVRFLREGTGNSINRGAVEIPRRIINEDSLKELDKSSNKLMSFFHGTNITQDGWTTSTSSLNHTDNVPEQQSRQTHTEQ